MGILLFGYTVLSMANGPSVFGSTPQQFEQESKSHFSQFVVTGFGGVALIGLGSFLLRIGFLKAAADIVSTETAGAVQHSSAAMGRGLAQGMRQEGFQWGGNAKPLVKVRCRSCGALDSEDARYCSACAKPM